MTTPQLPGWYPEPGYDRLERWWNGHDWTRAARPRRSPALETTAAAPRRRARPPMSTDATRACIITAITAAAFAIWGYTAVAAEPAPTPAQSLVSTTVPPGSEPEPQVVQGGA
jgi:hypothetical protein